MLMMTSLDGKIDGKCFEKAENNALSDFYDAQIFEIAQAWGNGANTHVRYFSDDSVDFSNFAGNENDSDNVILSDKLYAVSFDSKGRVKWKNTTFNYPKNVENQILVVTTRQSNPAWRAYLKSKNIPYIFAGDSEIDLPTALEKLKTLFKIERFALTGGAAINAAFIKADLVDEIRLVVMPEVEGSQNLTFCESAENLTKRFILKDVQRIDSDGLFLVYAKK